MNPSVQESASTWVLWVKRAVGLGLAMVVYAGLGQVDDLAEPARVTAAIGTLMALFWMTEALPLPVTALLPLILCPLLGVYPEDPDPALTPMKRASAPYANPFVFLYLGGFLIALGIERWGLHRRLALLTVSAVGSQPARLVGGFMLATVGLSMWISNTATTVLMLPIALSVIGLVDERLAGSLVPGVSGAGRSDASRFATGLLLGIAYSASLGGMATPVGTPPNVFLTGFLDSQGIELSFNRWLVMALPLVLLYLLLTWLVLTRLLFRVRMTEIPGGSALIREELAKLGRVSRGEWTVLIVFVLTALAWIARGPLTRWDRFAEAFPSITRLNDTIIALVGALALFALPVRTAQGTTFAMTWDDARRLPWGVLLLFGGGLSLASAVTASGLDAWIGSQIGQLEIGLTWLPVLATILVQSLTELTSNVATTSAMVPILFGVAEDRGMAPELLLIPATLAASCAFMLPVATPPNAIVYGSRRIRIGQMIWAGIWLNLVGFVLIPLIVATWGQWVFS